MLITSLALKQTSMWNLRSKQLLPIFTNSHFLLLSFCEMEENIFFFKIFTPFRLKWPSLLVFAATFWVYHAVVSILWLNQSNTLKWLNIPILNFSLCWTIRSGFDGHLRCWICHLMDCLLGVRWLHVDLWSQECLQGYQAHDWQRARMVLENHLGWCCTYFLVGDFHRLCSTMAKTSVCITVLY